MVLIINCKMYPGNILNILVWKYHSNMYYYFIKNTLIEEKVNKMGAPPCVHMLINPLHQDIALTNTRNSEAQCETCVGKVSPLPACMALTIFCFESISVPSQSNTTNNVNVLYYADYAKLASNQRATLPRPTPLLRDWVRKTPASPHVKINAQAQCFYATVYLAQYHIYCHPK